MSADSLEATEAECAEGRTAPRVSLSDIERVTFLTGAQADAASLDVEVSPTRFNPLGQRVPHPSLDVMTICLVALVCALSVYSLAKGNAPGGNPCLLIGEDGDCVGGVRRTSPLYQIVCLQAVLLFGLLAGFGVVRAFPVSQIFNRRWAAISAASMILGGLFLVAGITGKVWLFGI